MTGLCVPRYFDTNYECNVGNLGCQRRWSEAAAQDVTNTQDTDGTMRRWSMPWENSKVSDQQAAWPGSRLMPKNKLTVPGTASQDRSRSTTPGQLTFYT